MEVRAELSNVKLHEKKAHNQIVLITNGMKTSKLSKVVITQRHLTYRNNICSAPLLIWTKPIRWKWAKEALGTIKRGVKGPSTQIGFCSYFIQHTSKLGYLVSQEDRIWTVSYKVTKREIARNRHRDSIEKKKKYCFSEEKTEKKKQNPKTQKNVKVRIYKLQKETHIPHRKHPWII